MFNVQRFFLLAIGFLFFILGCGPDGSNILSGVSDLIQSSLREENVVPVEEENVVPTSDAQVSFESDLSPILSARCAFVGCHVAGGPEGLDLSTYESFIRGSDDGPVFTPGNARSSDIVEEIVSGRMPPGGPRLTDTQIQVFVDWINQQDSSIFGQNSGGIVPIVPLPRVENYDDDDREDDEDDEDDDREDDEDDEDDDHDEDDEDD